MLGYVCFKGWSSTGGRGGSGSSSGGRIGGSVGIIRRRRSVMISVAVEVPQKSSHSILQVGKCCCWLRRMDQFKIRIDMDWWVTFR